MTTLDPARYVCAVHHIDITRLVRSAVDANHSVSTLRVPDGAHGFGLRSRPASATFRVVVTCPGTGDDKPHRVVKTGTRVDP